VVFVLATTDPQKVPPTIRSRTQHLEFRLIGADTLHDLLMAVNEEAGLAMDEESVQAAVRRARGSARDALSALDQVAASGSADAARPELGSVLTAVAAGDASAVLVALSELMARGWGPQQLATELVDDLRQAFLAALAPALCALSGAEREQFTTLAESMGLARLVRAMEVLGRALIDMRDAPDPQVVLEIALVRTARADLDAGVEALTERVAALERTISSGGLAERPAPRPESTTPVAPPVAAPAPVADVGRRPSLGAIQRRQNASTEPTATSSTEPSPASVPETAPIEESAVPVAEAPQRPALTIDRDSLSQAWGDGILRSLPARAKALYSAGRFVAVDEAGAHYALPTAPHRDRCVEHAPQVEAAIAQHFGSSVTLILEVDGGAGELPPSGATPATAPTRSVQREEPMEAEEVDLEDIRAATTTDTDQASAAEARLLEAFPGASEVAE
jgi:DNA polymerase-3 subunit gamma/tau